MITIRNRVGGKTWSEETGDEPTIKEWKASNLVFKDHADYKITREKLRIISWSIFARKNLKRVRTKLSWFNIGDRHTEKELRSTY